MKHNLLLRSVALGTFYSNWYEIHDLNRLSDVTCTSASKLFSTFTHSNFHLQMRCNAHTVKPYPNKIQTRVTLHISATVKHIVSEYHDTTVSYIFLFYIPKNTFANRIIISDAIILSDQYVHTSRHTRVSQMENKMA